MFLWFLLVGMYGFAQISDITFRRVTLKDGLSQTSVYSIYQDYRGFMWFGTYEGLNRYDGRHVINLMANDSFSNENRLSEGPIYGLDGDRKSTLYIATYGGGLDVLTYDDLKVTHYLKSDSTQNSISCNNLYDVKYVNDSTVWVVGDHGLSKFNSINKTFNNYPLNGDAGSQNRIIGRCVYSDDKNGTWVGSIGSGIFKLNEKTGTYENYKNPLLHNKDKDVVRDIELYKDSLLLLASKEGLFMFNLRTHSYSKFPLESRNLFSVFSDKEGNVWVTSMFDGVYKIEKRGGLLHYKNEYCDKFSFPDNMVVDGMCDNAGNIWFATYNESAIMIKGGRSPFLHLYHIPTKPSIANNSVFSFLEGKDEKVWVGTQNGITIWDRKNNTFEQVAVRSLAKAEGDLNVWSMCFDKDQRYVWIGTSEGLIRYDTRTKKQKGYFRDTNDDHSLIYNFVTHVFEDSKGRLWVATRSGLSRYDSSIDGFYNYYADGKANALSNLLVWRLFEDRKGRIWVVNLGGVNLYNPEKDNFEAFKFEVGKDGIQSNDLVDIIEIGDDIYGLATSKGVSIFDYKQKKIIKNIGLKDGLANSYIYRFLQTGNEIWVSTNKGLAVIDKRSYQVKGLYFDHDGLQGDEFNTAAIKLSDGYFLFGGVNGISGFYPEKIKKSTYEPPIYFTGMSVNGREISIQNMQGEKDMIFEHDIVAVKKMIFNPEERIFSLHFAALDYSSPEEIKYYYRLLPETKEWVPLGNRNYVTFVNLNPGHYQLQVRSTNAVGVHCDNVRSLIIEIEPPFWKKKWVIVLAIVLMLVIIWLIFKYRTYKYEKDKRKLEKIVSERTKEIADQKDELEALASNLEEKVKERTWELEEAKRKAEESDRLKSAFLSNMSHEIRTPMNAIMGFSELLATTGFEEEERKSFANMVKANGDTLLTLLNDIIDISMIESGQLKLSYSDVNPADLIESVYGNFINSLLLTEKKGQLELRAIIDEAHKDLTVHSDFYRLMQIMNNLVGNAIKFTSKGYVEFGYVVKDKFVEFYVTDTGIGIGEEELKSIFKRFYKMQNGKTNFYPGNGLGLTITKNLVEALKGTITVESGVGKGTTFRFTIPM